MLYVFSFRFLATYMLCWDDVNVTVDSQKKILGNVFQYYCLLLVLSDSTGTT
jgi:hypothetical protein